MTHITLHLFFTSYIYYCLFINFIGYSILFFILVDLVTLYYTGMFSDYPMTNEI